jgi:glycerophosphoryl diester phosphodiesterase
VWAHRGSAGAGRKENTLRAFEEAVRLGADGIELDARLTADGAVVVHHDPEVDRLGAIRRLGSSDLPGFIPFLEEALRVAGSLLVNVELKDLPGEPGWDPAETLARAVSEMLGQRRGFAKAKVLVSSFSLEALKAVTSVDPGIRTGWLLVPGADTVRALAIARDLGRSAVHPHRSGVNTDLVTEAHRLELAVNTWTVNDADQVVELARQGVDALITDDVAMALRVLEDC